MWLCKVEHNVAMTSNLAMTSDCYWSCNAKIKRNLETDTHTHTHTHTDRQTDTDTHRRTHAHTHTHTHTRGRACALHACTDKWKTTTCKPTIRNIKSSASPLLSIIEKTKVKKIQRKTKNKQKQQQNLLITSEKYPPFLLLTSLYRYWELGI